MMNTELSMFRPAWTQDNLHAYKDLHFCGIKPGYFEKTGGDTGRQLDLYVARRNERSAK